MNEAQGNRTLHAFLRDELAATSIEYAIIAAGIGSAIVVGVSGLGTSVKEMWESVASAFG